MINRDELDKLIEEINDKWNRYDLSDEYLSEHNLTTRKEVGIGEQLYGITMVPCDTVKPYLDELQKIYHGININDIDIEKLNSIRENLYVKHIEDGLEDRCYKAIDNVFIVLNNKDKALDKVAEFLFHNYYKMTYVDETQFKKKKKEIIESILKGEI